MTEDRRESLQQNSQITLRSCSEKKIEKVFYIENEINRGSSAICYNAYYIDEAGYRTSGTLKEFYPYDFFSPSFDLTRDDSVDDAHKNQLYSHKGTLNNFLLFKKGYIRPYDILSKVRNKTGEYSRAKDLNNFIPSYELYQGISPDDSEPDNFTVYVWVKNEAGLVTFKQVLNDICVRIAKENYDGVKDLSLILRCILELAEAVDALHLFSLYHLDLKPDNFGIATYRDRTKENISISLYDINSLYSGRNRDFVVLPSGTKYFRSPEVAGGNINQFGPNSDVYSLGALLYYSLIINSKENSDTGDTEYFHVHFCEGKDEFDENEYNNIGVSLRNSLLLTDSDETQNSILFRKLYAILKKSLNLSRYHNDNGYYDTAEQFAEDIKAVIDILKNIEGSAAIDANTDYHAETFLQGKEDYFASRNKNGAAGVLQWLLFKYPLYDYCVHRENEEDGCNVLVLGGGTYASKFIDLAFELSQVKNCRLDITVVSNDAKSDRETYLATRPGMADFFEIDGTPAGRPEVARAPYGKLSFKNAELPAAVGAVCGEKKYTYIFVALGKEKTNKEVADLCVDAVSKRNKADESSTVTDSIVSYMVFGEAKKFKSTTDKMVDEHIRLLQLSVFDSLDKHREYDILRRMAFNAHLTWAADYINDIPTARAKFKSKYNFNSSLENALSIKYKLHSVDSTMELDFSKPAELAAKLTRIVGVPGDKTSGRKEYIRELTMYEHRRWIVEKITNSWQTLNDITQLRTDTKDNTNRRHPCIVPSREEFALSRPEWSNTYKKWDCASDSDKETLDGLDRLSVEMYQHFVKEAEKVKDDRRELDNQKKIIESISSSDAFAVSVCNDLNLSIDALVNDGRKIPGAINKYRYYKKLLSGVRFPEEESKKLSAALKKIDAILFPAIQAASHKNWKTVDEQLIRSIPFILTYSTSFRLCVPFFAEANGNHDTTSLFENVASALMLNPLTLTFIADGEIVLKDTDGFKGSLGYCLKILENHRLQTAVNVVVLRKNTSVFNQDLKNELLKISDKIRLVDEIVYSGWNQVKALREYLSQKSTEFTAIETNKTRISGLLQSANELALNKDGDTVDGGLFPMYSFDSRKRTFDTTEGCAFLSYVRNSPNLLTNDLFYSRGKDVDFSEPELINEDEFLWGLYTGGPDARGERRKHTAAWKALCGAVKEYQSDSNRIARFSAYCKNPDDRTEEYFTYFPSFCQETVNMIMKALDNSNFKHPFFDKDGFSITRIDSKSCKLTVKNIRNDAVSGIENLLMKPAALAEKDMVELVFMPEYLDVSAYSLRIENMKLPDKNAVTCMDILKKMNERKCIRSYTYTPEKNTVSFTFSTEHYMRLLKNEGNILELHVYRNAIASGVFNDVKTGAKLFWNNSRTSNELDVVMVKGFETFIVECKATFELKASFYDKLYPLTKTFGINNIPIIIADLDGNVSPANTLQINRGEELGIKTITKADNVMNEMLKSHIIQK